ncbi:MAG: PfkB family carbohydrate kinase, partial [Thermodesulfobacteriota bacterium]
KERGYKIVYDGERWREGIEDIMETADYFIPTAGFLDEKELGGEGLSWAERMMKLKEQVKGSLIVTAGDQGAYFFIESRLFQVPPPPLTAVDTIGAGDNFHAAFALALSRGFDLPRAVRFSVAVASLSCRDYGGRQGIPQWQEAVQTAACLACIPV